jgi:hypothetical protein
MKNFNNIDDETSMNKKRYWIVMFNQGLDMAFSVETLNEAYDAVLKAVYYTITDLDTGRIIDFKNEIKS